jgi:transcriptional regulator with XRE-family HTH domain
MQSLPPELRHERPEAGVIVTVVQNNFPALCRRWRRLRHLSQLDLATKAAVSQRHLSWLETGRSRPSRDMVLRLSEALDLSLRERNTLLNAAGYAPAYRESGLEEAHMAPVQAALRRILDHHEPFPALAVDRKWNLVRGNRAAGRLLALVGVDVSGAALGGGESLNLAIATLSPGGLRRFIANWDEVLPLFAQRLRSEAVASGDAAVIAHVEALLRNAGDIPAASPAQATLLPVMPLLLDLGERRLSLFTVISTFGTPQDITTDEMRIEAFYPGDETTAAFFRGSAS